MENGSEGCLEYRSYCITQLCEYRTIEGLSDRRANDRSLMNDNHK